MDQKKSGKTLWEIFVERLHGSNGEGVTFWNPLDLRVGSGVNVPFSNGSEFSGYDFAVQEIREYNRRISDQDFKFTDYVLRGVNKKSFESEDALQVRLRGIPNQAGAHDTLLLKLYDEFAFAEDFLGVVKDDTGKFEVSDDKTNETATFFRINDLRDSYEAAVLVVKETKPDGKAAVSGKASPLKLEYWDYWRDEEIGSGNKAKEFVFIEMNSDTGWFQIWRGKEFFS